MKSQLIGGFLAGVGGAVEVLSMYTRFQYSGNTGLGFDGIMVGIMAGYNPKLVPLAAFFYAYVKEGAAIWPVLRIFPWSWSASSRPLSSCWWWPSGSSTSRSTE